MNPASPELVAMIRHCYEEGFTPPNRGVLADWLEEHGANQELLLKIREKDGFLSCMLKQCPTCAQYLEWLLENYGEKVEA